MFSIRVNRNAFTLLEVILAVAIMALVTLSIYRFLELNLRSIQVSTDLATRQRAIDSLLRSIQHQLNALPPDLNGGLLGEAHVFGEKASDEISWITTAGNGLFTRNARGQFRATLTVQPIKGSSLQELGLRREEPENSGGKPNWLPLLSGIEAFEVRYYDLRLKAWVEKWTDRNVRPQMVRIRLSRAGEADPYEAVLSLPKLKGGGGGSNGGGGEGGGGGALPPKPPEEDDE